MTADMKRCLDTMIDAATALTDAWMKADDEHHDVKAYPAYLPSFDQFTHDLVAFRDANA